MLRAEIAVLLVKDAIEPVPPTDMTMRFYSPYFIKMLMQKHIFECIHSQDSFVCPCHPIYSRGGGFCSLENRVFEILNYLDDWLIHSLVNSCEHTGM